MKNPPLGNKFSLFSNFSKFSTLFLIVILASFAFSCNNESLSEDAATGDLDLPELEAKSVTIKNAGFESGESSWLYNNDTAVSSVTSSGNGIFSGGSKSIKVKSSGKRVAQVVSVSKNTNYQLRAMIMGKGKIGAGSGSTSTMDTDGDWKQIKYTFNSGSATSITIFGYAVNSNCRFDNFRLATTTTSSGSSSSTNSSTDLKNGAAIALRANVNEKYVVAENAGGASLIANRNKPGTWETFYVTNHSDGRISLKSHANNRYVAASNQSTALIANRSTAVNITKFTLVKNSNGTVSLKASNGKFVAAENAGSKPLIANRSSRGLWEQFYLVVLDGTSNNNNNNNNTSNDDDGPAAPATGNLSPNKAPSQNFDLSKWKLTLSSGDEVKVKELNNKFTKSNQFYTDPSSGGLVFKNYPKGAGTTSSSTYSRVEFREMLRSFNDDIDTKGLNKNNWVTSASSSGNKSKAGGVDGLLRATLAVNRVTNTSEEDWQVGRIIIGQIHAEKDEPCRLYYHKQPGHNKGAIYMAHEPSNGNPEKYYNLIGEYMDESATKDPYKYSGAGQPSNGIALNEKFSYKIEVNGNILDVVIYNANGGVKASKRVNMSNSGYSNKWVYYKAGLYSGNKTVKSSSDHEKVTFYALSATHD